MKYIKSATNALFSSVFLLTLLFAIGNRQKIYDWYVLRGYEAPYSVAQLVSNTGMSDLSRNVFYVYKPELLEKEAFNTICPIGEETIVLGCYDGRGIYIYNVTDTNLNGVKEVTAAHEMLHAQYDRLTRNERKNVDAMIVRQMALITDSRILKNIEAYRLKDPSVVLNESHSILGTEVTYLEPELEKYYSKYFSDRKKVVRLSETYEAVFTSIKDQVAKYDTQLIQMKETIDSKEATLTTVAEGLIVWAGQLESLKNNQNIAEYNSQVYSYNAKVDAYRSEVVAVKELIQAHNAIVEKRNKLSVEQNNLIQNIDSKSKSL